MIQCRILSSKMALIIIIEMFIVEIANAQTEQNRQSELRANELSAYMDKLTTDGLFSGAVLVAKGDVILFEKAYGMADKNQNIPNHVDTKFNLGSIAKTFTAIAIAKLVEQGKLSFDDVIKKYTDVFPDEVASKITIGQLLTHTSGLGNIFTPAYMENKDEVETVDEFMSYIINQSLSFEPGERHEYSNGGFIVLGHIIEKVSGENYYDYIRKHITEPLGMNNTGFYKKTEQIPNLARGYTRPQGDGQPQGIRLLPPPTDGQPRPQGERQPQRMPPPTDEDGNTVRTDNFFTLPLIGNPSGGAYSTISDMLKFSSALTNNTLLSKEHTGIVLNGKVKTPIGAYGYGFEVLMENNRQVVGHSGGAPGISALFRIFIDDDYTIIILSNYDSATRGLYEEIMKRYIMY